jgi:hypothetical protein
MLTTEGAAKPGALGCLVEPPLPFPPSDPARTLSVGVNYLPGPPPHCRTTTPRVGVRSPSDEDGSTLREFQLRQSNPFVRWVLSLAGEADIEDPPELKEELQVMGAQVAALYGGERGDGHG